MFIKIAAFAMSAAGFLTGVDALLLGHCAAASALFARRRMRRARLRNAVFS